MLRKSSDKVQHCYRRASQARESALRAKTPEARKCFFMLEDSWIKLAQHHMMTEALADFQMEIHRWEDE